MLEGGAAPLPAPKETTTIKDALSGTAGLAVETPTSVSVDKEAVAEGRKQLPSKLQDLAGLRTKATEIYGGPTPVSTGVD